MEEYNQKMLAMMVEMTSKLRGLEDKVKLLEEEKQSGFKRVASEGVGEYEGESKRPRVDDELDDLFSKDEYFDTPEDGEYGGGLNAGQCGGDATQMEVEEQSEVDGARVLAQEADKKKTERILAQKKADDETEEKKKAAQEQEDADEKETARVLLAQSEAGDLARVLAQEVAARVLAQAEAARVLAQAEADKDAARLAQYKADKEASAEVVIVLECVIAEVVKTAAQEQEDAKKKARVAQAEVDARLLAQEVAGDLARVLAQEMAARVLAQAEAAHVLAKDKADKDEARLAQYKADKETAAQEQEEARVAQVEADARLLAQEVASRVLAQEVAARVLAQAEAARVLAQAEADKDAARLAQYKADKEASAEVVIVLECVIAEVVKTAAAQDQEENARVLAQEKADKKKADDETARVKSRLALAKRVGYFTSLADKELYWMAQADDETARVAQAEAEADARILAARVLAEAKASVECEAMTQAEEFSSRYQAHKEKHDTLRMHRAHDAEDAMTDVDEIHMSVRDGVADATNWVEEGHGSPVVLGILANKLNQTRTQFLRNVIEGLRKSGSPMEQQTDELETLCRYIKPKWSNRVDGIKGLAIIVREFCVLMPGLYIQFVSRLTHHQLDCLSTKKAEPDMRIFITDQGYALDESDSMLANCGEGKLRGTPKDLCYMCYEEEPEPAKGKAFSRCRSSVCAAANIAPHALMCPRCLQSCPIARFRCLPIPIVREGRRQID